MRFHVVAILAMFTVAAWGAEKPAGTRGIWMWAGDEKRMGSQIIAGNAELEGQAIDLLKQWGIGRVYAAYREKAGMDPQNVAAWNRRLHQAGMQSQLLLSDNEWIFPKRRPRFLELIQKKLIDFNAGRPLEERFDALHLDIEPHGLKEWNAAEPAQRREVLFGLRDTYREVRAYLNAQGCAAMGLHVDLPVWFDEVEHGKKPQWESPSQRDDWWDAVMQSVTDISLMDYQRRKIESINQGAEWEMKRYPGRVRIGLEAGVGQGKTWKTIGELAEMAGRLEQQHGPAAPVDLHAFSMLWELRGK